MNKLSVLALSAALAAAGLATSADASPDQDHTRQAPPAAASDHSTLFLKNRAPVQQNLIGEVTAIDHAAGRITVKPDAGSPVSVSTNDKTLFRRIQPGQTSLANAEQIVITDIKVGDRVLVPGGPGAADAPVPRVIMIAREALSARDAQEREARRARTISGRITAIDAQKQEIIIQARGFGGGGGGAAAGAPGAGGGGGATPQAITVAASANAKLRRYAPDSLKVGDAVPASLADYRVGDQIRVVGDRSADGTRVTAEEIIAGSVSRAVGIITEVNAAAGEVVVKNSQTGQVMTVAIGKNTTLRRISPEVAEVLKQRFQRRNERRGQRAANNSGQQTQGQQDAAGGGGQQQQQRNRGERRNRQEGEAGQPRGNRNPQQLFETLPSVTLAELKKGDAVLVTATLAPGAAVAAPAARMTAVSIVTGDAELQQALQLTQGGRNNASNMSPGLPGNVSGGNAGGSDDDEPRK